MSGQDLCEPRPPRPPLVQDFAVSLTWHGHDQYPPWEHDARKHLFCWHSSFLVFRFSYFQLPMHVIAGEKAPSPAGIKEAMWMLDRLNVWKSWSDRGLQGENGEDLRDAQSLQSEAQQTYQFAIVTTCDHFKWKLNQALALLSIHCGTAPRTEIDNLMAKYKGEEHTMYLKICKKYNVQPEPEIKADAGPSISSWLWQQRFDHRICSLTILTPDGANRCTSCSWHWRIFC